MKSLSRAIAAAPVVCSILLAVACGYHVAGTTTRLPPDIKTIAIPVFANKSTRFRIEQQVAAAVTREFIQRSSFRVTPERSGADAELKGTINSVHSGFLTFAPNPGRATTFQTRVTVAIELVDLHTRKVLFSNPNYVFRGENQVSKSPLRCSRKTSLPSSASRRISP